MQMLYLKLSAQVQEGLPYHHSEHTNEVYLQSAYVKNVLSAILEGCMMTIKQSNRVTRKRKKEKSYELKMS